MQGFPSMGLAPTGPESVSKSMHSTMSPSKVPLSTACLNVGMSAAHYYARRLQAAETELLVSIFRDFWAAEALLGNTQDTFAGNPTTGVPDGPAAASTRMTPAACSIGTEEQRSRAAAKGLAEDCGRSMAEARELRQQGSGRMANAAVDFNSKQGPDQGGSSITLSSIHQECAAISHRELWPCVLICMFDKTFFGGLSCGPSCDFAACLVAGEATPVQGMQEPAEAQSGLRESDKAVSRKAKKARQRAAQAQAVAHVAEVGLLVFLVPYILHARHINQSMSNTLWSGKL